MTEQEYNGKPGIRRSDLWKVGDSPEKYLYAITHPEEPTPALVFGAMAHKHLLEPFAFHDEYVTAPDVDRRTKAGKEAWAEFVAANEGKTVVSADDYRATMDMVEAVRNHPVAGGLLGGRHEVPFFWTDEVTGEECKCRVDILTELDGKPAVADYKTAASAKTEVFNSAVFKHGYHLQAYMYTEAVMRNLGLAERPDFVFIVQEKKPPYSVNVIRVSDEVMADGERTFRELMDILHGCRETDYYYGYNGAFDEINETYLPGWRQLGEEED